VCAGGREEKKKEEEGRRMGEMGERKGRRRRRTAGQRRRRGREIWGGERLRGREAKRALRCPVWRRGKWRVGRREECWAVDVWTHQLTPLDELHSLRVLSDDDERVWRREMRMKGLRLAVGCGDHRVPMSSS
jgi:hypothetical protein